MMAAAVWHNVLQPLNVTGSPVSSVDPLDVLSMVNEINSPQFSDPRSGLLPLNLPTNDPHPFFDVDCDSRIGPLDVLIVINAINRGEYEPDWVFAGSNQASVTGGRVTSASCSPMLTEGDSLYTDLSQTVAIPDATSAIRVSFEAPSFDTQSQNSIRDAFEILLLDPSGSPITLPFGVNRDASFNWSESSAPVLGAGTQSDILPNGSVSTATFNVSGLAAGSQVQVKMRLVNNDSDTQTSVILRHIDVVDATEPAPTGMAIPSSSRTFLEPVDPNLLTDVTSSVLPTYGRTTLFDGNDILVTDLKITNQGNQAISGRVVVAIDNLSDPNIGVLQPDGFLAGGRPYFVLNGTSSSGWLASGETTAVRELRFKNPSRQQFNYTLTTLAELNSPPSGFTSAPLLEIGAGKTYRTTIQAVDPDKQSLVYAIVAGPANMTIDPDSGVIEWITTSSDVGNQSVVVTATDPFGLPIQQSFSIAVIENLANRPPIFTSTPSTEATVAGAWNVTTLQTGNNPTGLVAGDFGTGKISLVSANAGDQTVSVLGGSGNGKFQTPKSFLVGEPAPSGRLFRTGTDVDVGLPSTLNNGDTQAITWAEQADLNSDGTLDFVTANTTRVFNSLTPGGNTYSNYLSVVLNNADGSFAAPVLLPVTAPTTDSNEVAFVTTSVRLADFDGDGKTDILALYTNSGTTGSNQMLFWKGLGNGTFATLQKSDTGTYFNALSVADVNGDGKLDLLAIKTSFNQVGILFGNGDGTFGAYTEFANIPNSGYYNGMTISDLDGNNSLDVVLPSYNRSQLDVFLNDGQGHLIFSVSLTTSINAGIGHPFGSVIGDFTGDGMQDIAYWFWSGSSGGGGLGIYKGTGNGSTFVYADATGGKGFFSQVPYNTERSSPIDLNEDGNLDIYFGHASGYHGVEVGFGNGDGTFQFQTYELAIDPTGAPGNNTSDFVVLAGDYNRDGLIDLAAVSARNSTEPFSSLTVLLADAPGVFAAPKAQLMANGGVFGGPTISLFGDVNNDGIQDIVAGSQSGFFTRLGNGDGTFGPPNIGLGAYNSVTDGFLTDLNHDGTLDLVTSGGLNGQNQNAGYGAALGNGDGTFTFAFTRPAGNFYGATAITPGDFNGDGYTDFAAFAAAVYAPGTGTFLDGFHDVFLYDPTNPGTFLRSFHDVIPVSSQDDYTRRSFTTADFDGDSVLDLISVFGKVGTTPMQLQLFKGKGDGTFFPQIDTPILVSNSDAQFPKWLAAGDLNSDGKMDLVLTSTYSRSSVFLGNGDGTFQTPTDYSSGVNFSRNRQVYLRDINGDNNLDLVSIGDNYAPNTVAIRKGQGDGTFDSEQLFTTDGSATYLDVGDADGDGIADLISTNAVYGGGYAIVFTGTKPGLTGVATGDINGDSKNDLIAINNANNRVKVLISNGDNTFTRKPDVLVGRGPITVASLDFNADNKLDIVTANRSGKSVTILQGDGLGQFTRTDFMVGVSPIGLSVGDLTGDGKPDILVADDGSNAAYLLVNSASGFAIPIAIPLGDKPKATNIADATGDGIADAIFTLPSSKRIMILPGSGNGNFGTPIYVNLTSAAGDLASGDFNQDGQVDLAFTIPNDGKVAVLFSRGGGLFAKPQTIRVGAEPTTISTQDVDGDGRLDLLVANAGDATASVIFNTFDPTNLYRYTVTAMDPDGDPVAFDLNDAPGGMILNASTGQIVWAPTADQLGSNAVTIQATDGRGGGATQSFNIGVAPARANSVPVFTSLASPIVSASDAFKYVASAIDPDGTPLRYRLVSGPAGASIDPLTGVVTWDGRNNALRMNDGININNAGVISIPDSPSLRPTSLTAEGWFRFDNNTRPNQVLISKPGPNGNFFYPLSFNLGFQYGTLRAEVGGVSNGIDESAIAAIAWKPQKDRWYHLAMTFDDAAGMLTLWLDGQAVVTSATGLQISYNSSKVQIGAYANGADPFIGSVSQVRLWNNARTQADIQADMSRVIAPNAPGLIAAYNFNDGDAQTVFDGSVNGNNGLRGSYNGPWPSNIPGMAFEQTQSFTIRVEDGRGGSDEQTFAVTVVPTITQSISGTLYQDTNQNGSQDTNEAGSADGIIYIDSNFNGVRDPEEVFARTDSKGKYRLTDLTKGRHSLVAESQAGFNTPASMNVDIGPFLPGIASFALVPQSLSQIRGSVRIDSNGNGTSHDSQTIYESNFDAVSPDLSIWSTKSITTSPNSTKLLGEFFNESVTLSLGSVTPLPAHDSLTYTFDIALLRNWYGNRQFSAGIVPELVFEADGIELFRSTFSNFSNYTQAYPQTTGATNPGRTGALEINSLGGTDSIFRLTFTAPHSDPTANFSIRSLNQPYDRNYSAWGIRAVTVTATEPAAQQWQVFLDDNNSSSRDVGETTMLTDSRGNYSFTGLSAGSHRVRLDSPAGWATTSPTSAQYDVLVPANGIASGNDFIIKPNADAVSQPRFTTTPTDSATARTAYRFASRALDPGYRPLIYSLAAGPEGMIVDSKSGTIVWTPTLDQVGEQRVILRVVNDLGGVALQDVSITVGRPNSAPIITSTPLNTAAVDQIFRYDLLAQDAEQTTLDYEIKSGPFGAIIDALGRITWTPTAGQLGSHPFDIQVSDGQGATDLQSFSLSVVSTTNNASPAFAGNIRQNASVGLPYFAKLVATDFDGDALTFELISGPAGMQVASDGRISWSPTSAQVGAQAFRVRVSDGHGGIAQRDLSIQVQSNQTNRNPQITSQGAVFAVSGKEYRYDVSASDVDFDPVFFELVAGPSGLSMDPMRGTVRWVPAGDQFGQSTVTIRVADPYGGVDEQTYTISVRSFGGPPAITSIPSTHAAMGIGYLYSVLASDAEADPLTYSFLTSPTGMTINAITGELAWTPSTVQLGQNDIIIQVSDGEGGFATQAFTLDVMFGLDNLAPVIANTAPLYASVGTELSYQLSAADPEGSAITYQLRRGPSGIVVNATTGQVTWTPTLLQVGTQIIAFAASDSQGAVAVLSFELEVLTTNIAPLIQSLPPTKVSARGIYRYDVIATDQNLDPLRFTLVNGPAGMTVDPFGRIRWKTGVTDIGQHTALVRVIDPRGGSVEQSIAFVVVPDTQAPRVSVIPGQSIVRANSAEVFVQFNLTPFYPTNTVRVTAVDDVGVASLELKANGKSVAIDANGIAVFNFKDWGFGTVQIVATARDEAGNVGVGSKAFAFLPFGDDPAIADLAHPEAVITSPSASEAVLGFVDIVGSASSDNFTSYTLSYVRADGFGSKTIATGTTRIQNGVLGVWDTTLLENDEYLLRLEVNDDVFGTTVFEQSVGVSGNFKLGNFRLRFADITIPVAGIPITLSRTYDTLRADRDSELGFGWSLDFRNANLRTGLPKSGLEDLGIFTAFRPRTKVYVTLPGGSREGFTFTPDMRVLPGFGGQGLTIATPRFTPDRGVKNTLSVRGGTYIVNPFGELIGGGGQPYNPAAEEFGSGYTVTTPDGIAFKIDGQTGFLKTVRDRNNNTLTFSENGVTGPGNTTLTFERDARGRVTKAIDPAGNSVKYAYDAKGNLASVTDRIGNVTQYQYRTSPAHYLEKVIDPLGRTGVRTDYGQDGRLNSVTNGSNDTSAVRYDLVNDLVTTTDGLGHISTVGYDANGNVTLTTDPLGRTTRFAYDAANSPISLTDPLGRTTAYKYGPAGKLIAITDPLGRVTQLIRDDSSNVIATIDPLGHTTAMIRDSRGNVVSVIDPNGATTHATYDAAGQPIRIVAPNGDTTTYAYTSAGFLMAMTTPDGRAVVVANDSLGNTIRDEQTADTPQGPMTSRWDYTYNANGDMIGSTSNGGGTVRLTFDAAGQVTEGIDPMGRATLLTWDADGRQSGATQPAGGTVSIAFDAAGHSTSATLPGGRVVHYEYDAAGQKTATVLADGTRLAAAYDAAGQTTSGSNGAIPAGSRDYDAAGNLIRVTGPDGVGSRYEYDAANRLTAEIDALNQRFDYEYDAAGRLTRARLPTGQILTATYDLAGNRTGRTDLNGGVWQYTYAALGRPLTATDPNGNTYSYQYDGFGAPVGLVDPLGRVTHFTSDADGRLASRTLPGGGAFTLAYDPVGRLSQSTDELGRIVAYTYDADGRVLSRTDADGVESYAYNAAGDLATVTTPRGTTVLTGDEVGRRTGFTGPDGITVTYSPDEAGRAVSVTTPAGTTARVVSPGSRLTSVTDPAGNVTGTQFDANGRPSRITFANGMVEARIYDALGRTLSITWVNASNFPISRIVYTRDVHGKIVAVEETGRPRQEYDYDAGGRLSVERSINGSVTTAKQYSYDAAGNLAAVNDSSAVNTFSVDNDDRLLSDGQWTYTWNAAGTMASRSNGTRTETFRYDGRDRLIRMVRTGLNPTAIDYAYDYDGLLAERRENGAAIRLVWDRSGSYPQLLEERDGANALLRRYESDGAKITRYRDASGQQFFLLTDPFGTVKGVVDANGNTAAIYRYEAYGQSIGAAPTGPGFTGGWTDSATGFVFLRSRWYSPGAARFTSRDGAPATTANPSSTTNRYTYVGNDPINRFDPSGQAETFTELQAVTSIVAGLLALTFGAFAGASGLTLSAFKESLIPSISYWWLTGNTSGFGLGVSAGAGLNFSFGFGFEYLVNYNSSENAVFGYFGPSVTLGGSGLNVSASAGTSAVFDTPDANSYGGFFWSITVSGTVLQTIRGRANIQNGVYFGAGDPISIAGGKAISLAWSPTPTFQSDSGGSHFMNPTILSSDRQLGGFASQNRHSHTVGGFISSSSGRSLSFSISYYVPLLIFNSESRGVWQSLT